MARALITPIKTTEGSSNTARWRTSEYSVKCGTAGAYIVAGGSSRIDPSRLVFFIVKNSSYASTGLLEVIRGSTANMGKDYFPNWYSTAHNLNINVQRGGTGVAVAGGVSGRASAQFFVLQDAAQYLDSDDYIKFNIPAALTSKVAVTRGMQLGAVYLGRKGH